MLHTFPEYLTVLENNLGTFQHFTKNGAGPRVPPRVTCHHFLQKYEPAAAATFPSSSISLITLHLKWKDDLDHHEHDANLFLSHKSTCKSENHSPHFEKH